MNDEGDFFPSAFTTCSFPQSTRCCPVHSVDSVDSGKVQVCLDGTSLTELHKQSTFVIVVQMVLPISLCCGAQGSHTMDQWT